jgi:hypothetical protein
MSNVSHGFSDISSMYISKTEAVYENRSNYSVISRLIKEGKIAVHLVEGRIMLDRAETAREIARFKNRSVARPAVRASLFD